MVVANLETHILSLLRDAAISSGEVIAYAHGKLKPPLRLGYGELHTTAMQKAKLLRRCEYVRQGKIVLIHFRLHLDTIIWFWASILAGCVPCLSTPFVNHREGRVAHLQHLHDMLLDPIVITNQEFAASDFAENSVLRLLDVEAIENGTVVYVPEPTVTKPEVMATSVSSGQQSGDISDGKSTSGHAIGCPNGCATSLPSSTEGVAVLMLTSGSTGSAKAVCITHDQIFAAIRGKLAGMPCSGRSVLLNWIGLDHVASLIEIHLCAMFAGWDQVHVPAAIVLGDPLFFLRLLSRHKVSRTFAPQFFLYTLQGVLNAASNEDIRGLDLQYLSYIASGGEPNLVDTCAQVTKHLMRLGSRNQNIIVPGFGMTETSAGAIFNRSCPISDLQSGSEFTALGTCVPGIEMRISKALSEELTGKIFPDVGSLEVRGPIVFNRYFNNKDATRDAFTSDQWFKTGDFATIDKKGNLRLVGRSKELIIINGVKYLPREIERAIEQARIPGIDECFVACFAHRTPGTNTEEIYVVYQHSYDTDDVKARLETLRSIIRVVLLFAGARPHVLPLPPGQMTRTTLGKLSRTKIQTSLTKGEYHNQENLNSGAIDSYRATRLVRPRNDMERILLSIFLETLGLETPDMSIDTPVLDTGISSIDLIRLKSACEKAFGIAEIPMVTVMTNITIRSMAAAIGELRNSPQYRGEYNPVVTLQYSGSKTPLWLIHPGIGEILVFLGLVQYFPDRPIHALRARGFNPGEEPFHDLTDVVSSYYSSLRQQQPHGPYAIAGYSYGSMLAFEISKLLEADGEEVQFLGSFNLPPHIKDRMRMLDWTAGLLHIAHFCGIISEEQSEAIAPALHGRSQPEQVALLLAESASHRAAALALTHESLLNWTQVAWSLQKIGWEYDPSGTVGRMDVFYCQPLKMVARSREGYRNTKLNRWADFVREGVRFHEVDGEHYTMIGPDHVPKFQRTLHGALAARGL